jgi:hypothetical protein
MNDFDGIDERVVISPLGRKKRRCPEQSARSVSKKGRHSAVGKIPLISCEHNVQGMCVATRLSGDYLLRLFNILYSSTDKVKQDAILLSYMDIRKVQRGRRKVADPGKQKSKEMSVSYFVVDENKVKIPVCKSSFMSIF